MNGADARDFGMSVVLDNEPAVWGALYDYEFTRFIIAQGYAPFTGEDFKQWFRDSGHPDPHHPNAWGAKWNAMARDGRIVKTGEMTQAKGRVSHARWLFLWRRA